MSTEHDLQDWGATRFEYNTDQLASLAALLKMNGGRISSVMSCLNGDRTFDNLELNSLNFFQSEIVIHLIERVKRVCDGEKNVFPDGEDLEKVILNSYNHTHS